MVQERIRLVTRGDDSGSCHTANLAIWDAYEKGILRNTSIMAPTPDFEEAAEMYAGEDGLCVGLHVTLNAEWDGVRWGPVLPPDQVPSLVDPHGHFFTTTQALHRNNPSVEEMMAEVQAQLDLPRSKGLEIPYMDQHMGVGWIGGLQDRLIELCEREGIRLSRHSVKGLPDVDGTFDNLVDEFIARLGAAPDGTYLIVGHPGYDRPDMRAFRLDPAEGRKLAISRDWQRRIFMDQKVLDYCASNGITPIHYSDL